MGLLNLKTDLKSLKYGNDRPSNGSSNEPYVQTPIPENDSFSLGTDFLLRGNPIKNSTLDVSRLTQFLLDTKSAKGSLFTAKQNLLSLINVETETSPNGLNGGIYNPLNTVAQAGIVAFGGHLKKQGIDPTGLINSLVKETYEDVVKRKNEGDSKNNRLVSLYSSKMNNLVTVNSILNTAISPNDVMSYSGGPGSDLGIGITHIRFADQRTGKNNAKLKNLGFFNKLDGDGEDYSVFERPDVNLKKNKIFLKGNKLPSVSLLYNKLTKLNINSELINNQEGDYGLYNFSISVYTPFSAGTFPEMSGREKDNNTLTYTQQQLIDAESSKDGSTNINDFRKTIIDSNSLTTSTVMSLGPDYKTKNMALRVNTGDAGAKKDVFNYGLSAQDMTALDTLNALPIYEATRVNLNADSPTNDLVKFRIASLNNESANKVFMHFRAFITSFNDNYESKINSVQYAGRGEEFYNYGGFGRKISLGFKVYAQSKAELIPMYSKLNYLASTLAPDYTSAGFMRGNLVELTLGGYLYEQPGFITSLAYDIPQESPWEIGIDENGDYDSSVKELPLMINVSLNFQPIHNFVPRKDTNYQSDPSSKFISLDAGSGTNYEDLDSYKTYRKS